MSDNEYYVKSCSEIVKVDGLTDLYRAAQGEFKNNRESWAE
jgi:hypothetical protein